MSVIDEYLLVAVSADLSAELLEKHHLKLECNGNVALGHRALGGYGKIIRQIAEGKVGKYAKGLDPRRLVRNVTRKDNIGAEGEMQTVLFDTAHGNNAYSLCRIAKLGEITARSVKPSRFHSFSRKIGV